MKIWRIVVASVLPLLGAATLAGCFAPAEVATAPPPPPPPVPAPTVVVTPAPPVVTQRVITYPEGRYELRGDGRVAAYYWVWVPTGMTYAFALPAPPATTTVVVRGSVVQRTIVYPQGRYELYGDGVTVGYYWVWMPSGAIPPFPPPQPGS